MSAPRRSGFALLWSILLISMIAVLAAVVAPSVFETNDMSAVIDASTKLHNVAAAVNKFQSTVNRGGATPVPQTPNTLTQLTTAIANGGASGCTTTGGNVNTYNATSASDWTANGPYGVYVMPASGGLQTAIGTINLKASNSASAVGANRISSDPYFIQIQSVNVKLARLLDAYVDASPNAAADTVWYTTAAADSTVTVSYRVFFSANSC